MRGLPAGGIVITVITEWFAYMTLPEPEMWTIAMLLECFRFFGSCILFLSLIFVILSFFITFCHVCLVFPDTFTFIMLCNHPNNIYGVTVLI